MRTPRRTVLAVVLCLGLAPLARPQDSHYWTNQYGTRATLLGGAVIGSVLDLSGTYYNPGGMSLIEEPDTLMAAKVFHYPNVTLVGNGRQGVPLNADNPGPAPSLLAGTIHIRGLRKHWFGYSYLSRQEVKLGVSVSSTGIRDVLPDVPGPEQYATQFRLDEKVAERWFGLTWSSRVAKGVGVGVSQYVAVRSHRASVQELVEALTGGGPGGHGPGLAAVSSISNFRILWKLGVCLRLQRPHPGRDPDDPQPVHLRERARPGSTRPSSPSTWTATAPRTTSWPPTTATTCLPPTGRRSRWRPG